MAEVKNTVGLNSLIPPFNFYKWIEEHKEHLKPPIGAELVFDHAQFCIMVVGGPNRRTDYHINQTEEFFYQFKGDMLLKIVWDGEFKDVPIKEGEVFLLPGNTPHSPQRFENTVGLVIEMRRRPENVDKLRWYCENPKCREVVYQEEFKSVELNLGKAFTPIMQRYYGSEELRTCKKCGHVNQPPVQDYTVDM
eukprot:TRINITY_DN61696_c0_g1_i1.p1 TRINITY_DN61696_c0_g1~~TRINITY_DN61696_c0_g1_i1.p1  ORF type:complete len:193 (-),score=37.42 TRINITY_DN61696_c0_g1_i1:36-614(-)